MNQSTQNYYLENFFRKIVLHLIPVNDQKKSSLYYLSNLGVIPLSFCYISLLKKRKQYTEEESKIFSGNFIKGFEEDSSISQNPYYLCISSKENWLSRTGKVQGMNQSKELEKKINQIKTKKTSEKLHKIPTKNLAQGIIHNYTPLKIMKEKGIYLRPNFLEKANSRIVSVIENTLEKRL